VTYFNDILTNSTSLKLHVEHLCVALNVLRKKKLYANYEKCTFCPKQIAFMRFFGKCQMGSSRL